MLDMCRKGFEISAGKTRQVYEDDDILKLALAHSIHIIGEAADHVTDGSREKYHLKSHREHTEKHNNREYSKPGGPPPVRPARPAGQSGCQA